MKTGRFINRCFLPCLMTLALSTSALCGKSLNVVPSVQQWSAKDGRLTADRLVIVLDSKAAEDLMPVARLFRSDLEMLGFADTDIATGKVPQAATAVHLQIGTVPDIGRDLIPEESYQLVIGQHGIRMRANTPTGVFYATRTLLQLLHQSHELPCGEVVDGPRYHGRMLMIDVGRKPFPLPALRDYLRILGWYKMNELHLHLSDQAFGGSYAGFRVECDTFPGLASEDLFYSKQQLREFQDLAAVMGITITPEIDMPGHSLVFTKYWPDIMLPGHANYMDVTNPDTVKRMKLLLDEMIPVFDAPDFHIGTDEYRVGGPRQEEYHEAFRQFINTINAHVRSKGKNTRIWSGFEHMKGSTEIDPSIIIDMWVTSDAKSLIDKGHRVINSNHGRTYIVPGCHYYGVSNPAIYDNWEPWKVSGKPEMNPEPSDPRLIGGKLHIWNDNGPTGYNMTEIADLALPSIQTFAEKLWGTKGSDSYEQFQERVADTLPVPGVSLLERLPRGEFALEGELVLAATNSVIPWVDGAEDMVYPWTLSMEIMKTAETGRRGVILSSDLVEICSDYSQTRTVKEPDADGKVVKRKEKLTGLGLVRAAGSPGRDPASSSRAGHVSQVCAEPPPLNEWIKVDIVAKRGHTIVYLNGKESGKSRNQLLCPLTRLGSPTGNSFVGRIKNLKVVDRALSAKSIGRAAGLDIPDNLALGCAVEATASHAQYGLIAAKAVDGDPSTRWSSGPTRNEQALTIDLGQSKRYNKAVANWENAYPNAYSLQASDDGESWTTVWEGSGVPGSVESRFETVQSRYLRVKMSQPATQWGYSIWELAVFREKSD